MGKYSGICDIKSITNAQDYNFWADEKLYAAKDNADATGFDERKKIMKYRGFKIVSDQTGNIFNPDVLLWFGPDDLQATKSRFAVGRSGAFPQVDGKRKISDPDYLGRKALSIGLSGDFDIQSLGRRK